MDNGNLTRGTPEPGFEPNRGSEWIAGHWEELPKNEWVAARPTGKIASHPTFDGLMEALKGKKVDPENVAIAYIDG